MNPLNWIKEGVPKIGVDWYAKGGIMTKPTAFGIRNGRIQGGGEKDNEAILPLNQKNLSGIGQGIVDAMGGIASGDITISALEMMLLRLFRGLRLSFDPDGIIRIVDDRLLEVV